MAVLQTRNVVSQEAGFLGKHSNSTFKIILLTFTVAFIGVACLILHVCTSAELAIILLRWVNTKPATFHSPSPAVMAADRPYSPFTVSAVDI